MPAVVQELPVSTNEGQTGEGQLVIGDGADTTVVVRVRINRSSWVTRYPAEQATREAEREFAAWEALSDEVVDSWEEAHR